MTKPTKPEVTRDDLSRQCAADLANMITGNGWLDFSDLLRGEMASVILRYMNTAQLIFKEK